MAKLLSLSNAMYNIERILQLHGNIYEKATTFLKISGYILFCDVLQCPSQQPWPVVHC